MSSSRFGALGAVALTLAAAELGVRLLSPRRPAISVRPPEAEAYFEPVEIERGRRFARPQLALGLATQAVQLGALAGLSLRARRPRRSLHRLVRPGRPRPVPTASAGAAEALRLTATLNLVSLPTSAWARRRAQVVGLDTQSWIGWASDLIKMSLISSAFAAAGGALLTGVRRRYPRGWWLPVAGGSVAGGALFGGLAPVLLEPLFNRFEPLPEGETRSDVLELARAAGVRVGEVLMVDASRRTTGANAYVSGLGPSKRVVLFDTLLDRYDRREVRVVVAHELSHVRHRDVRRGLILSAVVAPPAALAVQRLGEALAPPPDQPGLAALALALGLVSLPVVMVAARLSRAMERRADAESLELSGDPEAFISFQRAVVLQNLADVEPPRWVRALVASHPPALERIGAALAFGQPAGGS
jgi:STE24 endopeptidase